MYTKTFPSITLSIVLALVGLFARLPAQAQQNKNMTLVGTDALCEPRRVYECPVGLYRPARPRIRQVGTCYGMSVVDITDPANLQELYFVADAGSTWREVKRGGIMPTA